MKVTEPYTYLLVQDWIVAAVLSLCSPPGPCHTPLPHMTSPACWPLEHTVQQKRSEVTLPDETRPHPKIPLTSFQSAQLSHPTLIHYSHTLPLLTKSKVNCV